MVPNPKIPCRCNFKCSQQPGGLALVCSRTFRAHQANDAAGRRYLPIRVQAQNAHGSQKQTNYSTRTQWCHCRVCGGKQTCARTVQRHRRAEECYQYFMGRQDPAKDNIILEDTTEGLCDNSGDDRSYSEEGDVPGFAYA